MSTTHVFPIAISCMDCVNVVHDCLNTTDQPLVISFGDTSITLLHVNANFVDRTLTVTLAEDVDPSVVVELLNTKLEPCGFPCRETPPVIHFFPGLAGVVSGLAFMMLPLIVGPLSLFAMAFFALASVALTLVLGRDSYTKAWKLLVNERKLHMDTLFSVSTLAAMSVSIAAFFIPGLPMMFEAGLLIFGFRHIGEAIRASLEQSMGLRARFQDLASQWVNRCEPHDHVSEVSIHDINCNDIILIKAGEVVPVDGVCLEGSRGLLKTSIANGNLEPETIRQGVRLSAGMTLLEGAIRMKVSALASESLLARKDKSIAASLAKKEKASWETTADRVMHYFIPTVFLLAIVSGLVVGYFFSSALAIQCALSVLVSACPCTLGLVTGLAVKVGMKKALTQDVVFKSSRTLEEMETIQHVVFDLNGTLTTRTPEIRSFHIHDTRLRDKLFFDYFAALETHSSKAIAQVICKYHADHWRSELTSCDIDVSHSSGIKGIIEGETYLCGNQTMMMEHGIMIPPSGLELNSDETIVYLARGDTVLGHIVLARPLRKEARDVVLALQKMGKQVYVSTGSTEDTALRYAASLGIPEANVRHSMSSSDKVDYIHQLKINGDKVAMIGDELNDADAITASDFGMAMPADGGSLHLTRKLADAVSNIDSLHSIIAAFEISQQTVMNIKQNLKFSLAYNIAAMLLPAGLLLVTGITLSPGVGVALMILQTSLILLNTYRFKQQRLVCLEQAAVDRVESSYESVRSMMPGPNHQTSLDDRPLLDADETKEEERYPASGLFFHSPTHRNTNVSSIPDRMGFTNGYG